MNRRQDIVLKRSHIVGLWIGLAAISIVMFIFGVVAGTKMCTCPETVIDPTPAAPAAEAPNPGLEPVEILDSVGEPAPKPEDDPSPTKPAVKPQPKPEPEAKPEPKPEAKPEPKPAPKPEPKPEPGPEAKPEPKPQPKAPAAQAGDIQYSVQVISYLGRARADEYAKEMGKIKGLKPYVQEAVANGLKVFRVRIGVFATKEEAEQFRTVVSEKLGKAATVVVHGK